MKIFGILPLRRERQELLKRKTTKPPRNTEPYAMHVSKDLIKRMTKPMVTMKCGEMVHSNALCLPDREK
jgi:hypothetical protein